MARPRLKIDLELVEKLAAIHCLNNEIAAIVGCERSLLSKPRFSHVIEKARERGKMSLRKKMFETAMGGNVTMQIWLSKQYLDMSEKIDNTNLYPKPLIIEKLDGSKVLIGTERDKLTDYGNKADEKIGKR